MYVYKQTNVLASWTCAYWVMMSNPGHIKIILHGIVNMLHIIIIIIIIVVIVILVITFMQGIYNYILETNHVSRIYSVAAVFYLQFVLHVMLFRPWNVLYLYVTCVCIWKVTITRSFVMAIYLSIGVYQGDSHKSDFMKFHVWDFY
jgi:hypothetical protein